MLIDCKYHVRKGSSRNYVTGKTGGRGKKFALRALRFGRRPNRKMRYGTEGGGKKFAFLALRNFWTTPNAATLHSRFRARCCLTVLERANTELRGPNARFIERTLLGFRAWCFPFFLSVGISIVLHCAQMRPVESEHCTLKEAVRFDVKVRKTEKNLSTKCYCFFSACLWHLDMSPFS